MEINQEHVTAFITGALSLWAVLKASSKHTATTKDDELVEAGERLKEWTKQKATVIWPLVELAGKTNSLPQGVSKAIWALELLKKAYQDAHGSTLPSKCEETARNIWATLSSEQKRGD